MSTAMEIPDHRGYPVQPVTPDHQQPFMYLGQFLPATARAPDAIGRNPLLVIQFQQPSSYCFWINSGCFYNDNDSAPSKAPCLRCCSHPAASFIQTGWNTTNFVLISSTASSLWNAMAPSYHIHLNDGSYFDSVPKAPELSNKSKQPGLPETLVALFTD